MDIEFIISVFCVATMFAIGLDVTVSEAMAPFRHLLALGIIILINNVFTPLLGFVVIAMPSLLAGSILADAAAAFVPLTGGQLIGFLLLLLCAGSLLGPAFAEIAGASASFARGVMVVLVVVSTVLVPFELELLCGFNNIPCTALQSQKIVSGSIFMTLLLYQLLPLAAGIVIKAGYDAVAVRLRPFIIQFTHLSFFVLVALMVASNLVFDLTPTQAPVVETELFSTAALTSTETLDAGDLPVEVREEFRAKGVVLPPNPAVLVREAGANWVIVNADTLYAVENTGKTLSISSAKLPDGGVELCAANEQALADCAADLNAGQITTQLRNELMQSGESGVTLLSDLVIVLKEGSEWVLVTGSDTYFLAADGGQITVTQQISQPVGLVAEFLKSLEMLPAIGPVLDFLMQLVVELLPFAMLVAVAALILLIGNYGGIAVRNVAEGVGNAVPHALATSTTVRNISMALILAGKYFVDEWPAHGEQNQGLVAIAMVLTFYLISLIVAAHQAVQWRKATKLTSAVGQTAAADLAHTVIAGADR